MSDLISREALLKELRDWARSLDSLSENVLMAAIECTCVQIEEFPAVDAEPVRHGQWKKSGSFLACSECGRAYQKYNLAGAVVSYYWCPNCGAKMHVEG